MKSALYLNFLILGLQEVVFNKYTWYIIKNKEVDMQDIVTKAITHGVYIITARTKEKINGMTAAWVSQASLQPLMLMASIAPARYTHGIIKESGYFVINALADGQEGLAKHFGFKSGRKFDKFKDIPYFDAPNGSPVLKEALAFFECKVMDIFKAGDHSLFVGNVVEAKLLNSDKKSLIFRWEDYF
jgi:flavin reductase (DIM6/NTAB) family NADH-FMN oxidoreductase RutF